MGKTKKKTITTGEIDNFMGNTSTRFDGQRNTLTFLKKLGNVDATEVIFHAAEKEVSFVIERMIALQTMMKEEGPLSDEATTFINNFVTQLYDQTVEDITFPGFDNSSLIKKLNLNYKNFLSTNT